MNFFKAVLGNRCRSMFVKRPKVTSEVKLLVDGQLLVAEDCANDHEFSTSVKENLHTDYTTLGNQQSPRG